MSTSDISKDGASKSNDDGVCDVNDMLNNMSTVDIDNNVSVCASCGKEGDSNNMNICNKCKQVKYCNAVCKKKHRHKHKKECERSVAELHDIELFKQPPTKEDCPICFQRLPVLNTGYRYQTCCGKVICSGCIHAPVYDNQGNKVDNQKCPFCRTPHPTSEEDAVERLKIRMKAGDANAISIIGGYYADGLYGYRQDYKKALELFHRAGELGYANAYTNIGYAYDHGEGVEKDEKKANHYYEIAAIKGNVQSRYNLGNMEGDAGNTERALKHFLIAVEGGYTPSLERIKDLYSKGHATKEDYTKALQLYQKYLGEIKSTQRDKAAADERNRYY